MIELTSMEKVYDHTKVEGPLYKEWEERGYFKPEVNPDGTPYAIILPPPNANGALHFGHAMFTVEDILARYHRMKGDAALWFPGSDHAGIETQFVFEKKLKDQGKSRLDYKQEELFQMISDYVDENRGGIEGQLRRLGFSLDWSREKYTLDSDVVKLVHKTFKKMYDDGLVYRDYRLVNYCTFDGTSFSDLEVVHEERERPLYYIKYGPLVLATTRPETKFGDTAVAVHPEDERYSQYVGKEIEIETVLGPAKIKVIADTMVDPAFGTGVVKITPAHDFNDFETGKRHDLPMKQVIGFDGKMNHYAGKFEGLYIKEARRQIIEEMQEKGLVEEIDEKYVTNLNLCYKCKNVLEPLPLEQWFIKVKPLTEKAIAAAKNKEIKIFPDSFESQYYQWLENLRDWNISRQIVWGIRIPAWKNKNTGEWMVTEGEGPAGAEWEQDEDTFDTWFSSSQWPIVTLKTSGENDYEKFYPTSVMETGYDLLRLWVCRMIMMGLYLTGEVPFKHVLFHGLVNDPYGKKMSKSKGNVVNPMELIDQYGADAVRFALVYGNSTGNDQSLSYPKLEAARRFTNKLWNIGRYAEFYLESESFKGKEIPFFESVDKLKNEDDKEIVKALEDISKKVTKALDAYRFNEMSESLYEFVWHFFADKYMEQIKERLRNGDLEAMSTFRHVFLNVLKLLHPVMPFITEELWGKMPRMKNEMLIISRWPATI